VSGMIEEDKTKSRLQQKVTGNI